ncbi:MAG: hypothetical protein A2Y90_03075 [Chloroflexi bacterium RBG_13_52_12]|nr:MAG: hypothetical protein A2Y90_03075 [Chloroflexi bacterium RBG_13_52_12]
MKKKLTAVLIASMLLIPLIISGCTSETETALPEEASMSEGFAIYLTKDDIPVQQMPALSHLELADEPSISRDDIIWYFQDTHEIELTPEAYERLEALEIRTFGKSFVVCVDKQPVYWGAFWVSYSSQSFDGITIQMKPTFVEENRIKISRGFPSDAFASGEDPRSNPEIKASLEKAGKLK